MTTTRTRGSATPTTPTPELDEDLIPELAEPGFMTLPTPGPDPLDPTATTVTGPATHLEDRDGVSDDASDGGSERTASTTPSGRSSQASTEALPGLQDITRTLVGIATLLVRTVRARTLRRQLPPAAWVATEEDMAAIGDPLARIASRHVPAGGGASADVVDATAALVGVTGYAMRSMAEEADDTALVDLDPNGPDPSP